MHKLIENTFISMLPTTQEPWFENLIADIDVQQPALYTDDDDENVRALYQHAIAGSYGDVLKTIRKEATQVLIKNVVLKFLQEVIDRNALPDTLAFALTPSTILVWAEIDDDDETREDNLLMAETKMNVYASQFNLSIDTLVVEKSDLLQVPDHYIKIKRS
jgi:hypothetical protein